MPSTIGIVAGGVYVSPFTPADLTPKAWFDASDTSTITASSGAVSQWNNKGSLGNLSQATSAQQPGTGAVTQNGLNVLTFDGSDWMSASTQADWKFLHDGTKYVVAAAVQWGTSTNPDALYVLVSTYDANANFIGTWAGFDDRPTRDRQLRHRVNNGSGNSVENVSANAASTAGSFTVFSVLADPSNGTASARSSLFNNAGSAISNNTLTSAVSTSNPQYPLYVGVIQSDTPANRLGPLVGRVGEIVIVSGANATEANRVALRDYLNTKWAVY